MNFSDVKMESEKAASINSLSKMGANPYIVLSLPENSSFEEIRKARVNLLKCFNPDRVDLSDITTRNIFHNASATINDAFGQLRLALQGPRNTIEERVIKKNYKANETVVFISGPEVEFFTLERLLDSGVLNPSSTLSNICNVCSIIEACLTTNLPINLEVNELLWWMKAYVDQCKKDIQFIGLDTIKVGIDTLMDYLELNYDPDSEFKLLKELKYIVNAHPILTDYFSKRLARELNDLINTPCNSSEPFLVCKQIIITLQNDLPYLLASIEGLAAVTKSINLLAATDLRNASDSFETKLVHILLELLGDQPQIKQMCSKAVVSTARTAARKLRTQFLSGFHIAAMNCINFTMDNLKLFFETRAGKDVVKAIMRAVMNSYVSDPNCQYPRDMFLKGRYWGIAKDLAGSDGELLTFYTKLLIARIEKAIDLLETRGYYSVHGSTTELLHTIESNYDLRDTRDLEALASKISGI